VGKSDPIVFEMVLYFTNTGTRDWLTFTSLSPFLSPSVCLHSILAFDRARQIIHHLCLSVSLSLAVSGPGPGSLVPALGPGPGSVVLVLCAWPLSLSRFFLSLPLSLSLSCCLLCPSRFSLFLALALGPWSLAGPWPGPGTLVN